MFNTPAMVDVLFGHVFMVQRIRDGFPVSYTLADIDKESKNFFEFGFYTMTEYSIVQNMVKDDVRQAWQVKEQLIDVFGAEWFNSTVGAEWEKELDKYLKEWRFYSLTNQLNELAREPSNYMDLFDL